MNEIPRAVYFAPPEALRESVTAQGVGRDWRVIVTGYAEGEYALESMYLDSQTVVETVQGTTTPGKVEEYLLQEPRYHVYIPLMRR